MTAMTDQPARRADSPIDRAMSRLGRFGGAAAGTFAAKIGGVAFAFALQVVLARSLAPIAYGDFVVVFGLLQVAVVIAGCGMPFAALRFMPRYRVENRSDLTRGFINRAAGATVVGAMLIVAATLVALLLPRDGLLRDELDAALHVGVALVLPMALLILLGVLLQAEGRPVAAEFVQNGLRFALTLVLVVLALAIGVAPSAASVLAAYGIVTVACAVGLVVVLRRALAGRLAAAARYETRLWLASGSAMLLVLSASILNERLDLLMIGALLGSEQAGLYAPAQRIAQLLTLGTASVNAVLASLIAARQAAGDRAGLRDAMTKAARMATAVTLPGVVFVVAAGPFLLGIFGDVFRASAGALNVLALSQLATALFGSVGGLVVLVGHNRPVILATLAAVALNVLFGLALIPAWGLEGAALAQLLATQASTAALAIWAWRHLRIDSSVLGLRGST